MRTKEEIFERINDKESMDLFGTQRTDLFSLLTFEEAKPFLSPTYVSMIEKDDSLEEEKWHMIIPKEKIEEYMPFAYDQAKKRRAMVTERCLLHFKTWIWYDDPKFYNSIAEELTTCTDYGIGVYNKIVKHYNITLPTNVPVGLIEIKSSPDDES